MTARNRRALLCAAVRGGRPHRQASAGEFNTRCSGTAGQVEIEELRPEAVSVTDPDARHAEPVD
jgi:hypothetical protein